MDNHLTIRLPKRLIKATLVLALVAAVISPIAVSASHVFDDVPDSNVFHEDIAWLANAGVTFGCNPPTNTNYCPNDNVTRAQMAAFMRRLAENQVVDAASALTAGNADNAAMLGGAWPNEYMSPMHGASCFGNACPDAAGFTKVAILDLEVNAPVAGFLTIGTAYTAHQTDTNGYTQTWVTMDVASDNQPPCGPWFAAPLGALPGTWTTSSVDGNVSFTADSSYTVTPVTAGNHTLTLCAIGLEALDTQQGSLTAMFSAQGSTTQVPLATGPDDFSALIDGYDLD